MLSITVQAGAILLHYLNLGYLICIYIVYYIVTSEVMKDDNALYGSPGADMVAMGDQVLQEDGGNMGGASSWDQFSNGKVSYTCIHD